jgi:hypothetical protein
MKKIGIVAVAAIVVQALAPFPGLTQENSDASESQGVALTIYNQNFGLVKDTRKLGLKPGLNVVRFTDVAAQIDPTSVSLQSLSAPNSIAVREQNYQYDLIDPTSILAKSVGKTLKFRQVFDNGNTREFTGVLMNSPRATVANPDGGTRTQYSGLVVRTAEGVILNPVGQIEIAELPPGLISKPTLVWRLETSKPGDHTVEVAYQTGGISWKSDYVAILDKDDTHLDLTSWVTLDNKSGGTYRDASLKLMAGDVHRVTPAPPPMARFKGGMMAADAMAPQFQEAAFAEYHLYTLQGKTTVADNETKQLSLFTADNIPAQKMFVYEPTRTMPYYGRGGGDSSKKVNVKIEVENSQKNHLGMPMPGGKVRVYKKDADGALQFVGEDNIDHTPKDEKVRLYIGDAFDVIGERRVMRSEQVSDRVRRETVEVSLRNHKETGITVTFVEHPYGDWTVMNSSHPHRKKDNSTLEFPIKVAANSDVTLTFTIEYRH